MDQPKTNSPQIGPCMQPDRNSTEDQIWLADSSVYRDLKFMAERRLAGNSMRNDISDTSLVHEAMIRFSSRHEMATWHSRKRFFATMAYIMRSCLVDKARKRELERVHIQEFGQIHELLKSTNPIASDAVLCLDAALVRLSDADAETSRVVHLRLFLGLTFAEIAHQLGFSERTAQRYWTYGVAWLRKELEHDHGT